MSPLKQRCDDNLIHDGCYLFGDAAYVNEKYMATPFKNVGDDSDRDNYNYFHSQLRINVECAFGMLVNRFTILRKLFSSAIAIHKVTALTIALCKLHTYLVDVRVEKALAQDIVYCCNNGGFVDLEENEEGVPVPTGLLHGGEHLDDVSTEQQRRDNYRTRRNRNILPREKLLGIVIDKGIRRPTPRAWLDLF